jgi:amino acid adenylation domain-containing protein
MLKDTALQVMLTSGAAAERWRGEALTIVRLDEEGAAAERESENRPPDTACSQNLAYVIYTSGSTGTPKGTLLPHRGVVNFIQAHIRALGVGTGDRILQFAAFSFDASVSEIFTALLSGATLCLVRPADWFSGITAADFLRREAVTMAILPPSLLKVLPAEALPDLKIVISAGEACEPETAVRWSHGRCFYNGYGPTEASVGPLLHAFREPGAAASVSIGRPLANLQAYVLDPGMQPLPVGIAGELWIGGMGLARGYLGRADMTADRFRPDPFCGNAGARIYRTGDLARHGEDGTIEFLGRIDHQVKIRGFRVELGEIESVLLKHPRVRRAALTLQAQTGGDSRLIAYVEPETGEFTGLTESLRTFLRERLPAYMLPARYIVIERLPLNPAGKVDRRGLPAVEPAAASAEASSTGPRDALEHVLCGIWEDLLEVHPVGVQDSFFDLGGHSLTAIRLMARLREKFGKLVSLVDFFREPTVANLAGVLRRQDVRPASSSLVPLQVKGTGAPLFIVHPSGGLVHWYLDLAQRLEPHAVFGLQARGVETPGELHTGVGEMAAHYIEAIREFQPQGPYNLASWSMGVVIAFEMALQLQAQGQPPGALALLDQGPECPAGEPEDDAAYLVEVFGKQLPLSLEELRRYDPEAQLAYVWQSGRRAQWLLPEVTLEQFKGFVKVLRLHTDAFRTYRPGVYAGRITLIRAADQPHEIPSEPDMGWGRYAAGGVEVRGVPGDHLSMLQEPHVGRLAEEIQVCLAAYRSRSEYHEATPVRCKGAPAAAFSGPGLKI